MLQCVLVLLAHVRVVHLYKAVLSTLLRSFVFVSLLLQQQLFTNCPCMNVCKHSVLITTNPLHKPPAANQYTGFQQHSHVGPVTAIIMITTLKQAGLLQWHTAGTCLQELYSNTLKDNF